MLQSCGYYGAILMNLSLHPHMQRFIEEKVKSGEYATHEDVVHAGLVSMMQQVDISKLSPEELEALYPDLRRKVAEGMEDIRAGRVSDGEAFFEELEREEAALDQRE